MDPVRPDPSNARPGSSVPNPWAPNAPQNLKDMLAEDRKPAGFAPSNPFSKGWTPEHETSAFAPSNPFSKASKGTEPVPEWVKGMVGKPSDHGDPGISKRSTASPSISLPPPLAYADSCNRPHASHSASIDWLFAHGQPGRYRRRVRRVLQDLDQEDVAQVAQRDHHIDQAQAARLGRLRAVRRGARFGRVGLPPPPPPPPPSLSCPATTDKSPSSPHDRYCGWVAEGIWPEKVHHQVVTLLRKGERLGELGRGILNNGNYGKGKWEVDAAGCPRKYAHRPFCKAFPLVRDGDEAHQAFHKWVWKEYDCDTDLPLESKKQPRPLREQLNWNQFVKEHILDSDASTNPLFGYPYAYNPTADETQEVR